jgi:hypothetical protein
VLDLGQLARRGRGVLVLPAHPGHPVIARVSAPLPECRLCERPTRRAVYAANRGLCSECADVAETVRMLPVQLPPAPDDLTAYVERYLPPVPPRKDDQ